MSKDKKYIIFYQHTRTDYVSVNTNLDFFKETEEFYFTVDKEKITFKKPTLDFRGKLYKPNEHYNLRTFAIKTQIPLHKKFHIDEEESNEDQIVIYINE